jgi:hypothetical protein
MVYSKKRKVKTKKNKYPKSKIKSLRKRKRKRNFRSKKGGVGGDIIEFATDSSDIKQSLKEFTIDQFQHFIKQMRSRRRSTFQQRSMVRSPSEAPEAPEAPEAAKRKKQKKIAKIIDSNTITIELTKLLENPETPESYVNFFYGKKIICWKEYVEYLKINPSTSDSYNKFREFFIDFHIVSLLNDGLKDLSNYSIKKNISDIDFGKFTGKTSDSGKKYILLYEKGKGKDLETKLEIFFEMVGSQDRTSDYDVSIWSNPPNSIISYLNYRFNTFFINNFGKSSGEIFDTNIYTHPIYLFSIPTPAIMNPFFMKIDERYMINPGRDEFFKNEKAFANFLFLKGTKKDQGGGSYYGKNFELKDTDSEYESIDIYTLLDNKGVFFRIFLTEDFKILPKIKALCLDKEKTLKDMECKKLPREPREEPSDASISDPETQESLVRKVIEEDINTYLTSEFESSDLENLKKKYIAPMRAALALADETYTTFSSYFHVIHIMATPEKSMESIEYLLSTPEHINELKNICVVSAIENFAFMFHYYKLEQDKFIKKTAKYLARVSHACFLRKQLDDPKITSEEIRDKIKTRHDIGSCNSIIKKFKKNDSTTDPTTENDFYKIFLNRLKKTSIELLKELYTELTSTIKYGINSEDLIISISTFTF